MMFSMIAVVPGRERSERTRNLEIPGSRYARPGMTVLVVRSAGAGTTKNYFFAAAVRSTNVFPPLIL
jgi:hypothetical protein